MADIYHITSVNRNLYLGDGIINNVQVPTVAVPTSLVSGPVRQVLRIDGSSLSGFPTLINVAFFVNDISVVLFAGERTSADKGTNNYSFGGIYNLVDDDFIGLHLDHFNVSGLLPFRLYDTRYTVESAMVIRNRYTLAVLKESPVDTITTLTDYNRLALSEGSFQITSQQITDRQVPGVYGNSISFEIIEKSSNNQNPSLFTSLLEGKRKVAVYDNYLSSFVYDNTNVSTNMVEVGDTRQDLIFYGEVQDDVGSIVREGAGVKKYKVIASDGVGGLKDVMLRTFDNAYTLADILWQIQVHRDVYDLSCNINIGYTHSSGTEFRDLIYHAADESISILNALQGICLLYGLRMSFIGKKLYIDQLDATLKRYTIHTLATKADPLITIPFTGDPLTRRAVLLPIATDFSKRLLMTSKKDSNNKVIARHFSSPVHSRFFSSRGIVRTEKKFEVIPLWKSIMKEKDGVIVNNFQDSVGLDNYKFINTVVGIVLTRKNRNIGVTLLLPTNITSSIHSYTLAPLNLNSEKISFVVELLGQLKEYNGQSIPQVVRMRIATSDALTPLGTFKIFFIDLPITKEGVNRVEIDLKYIYEGGRKIIFYPDRLKDRNTTYTNPTTVESDLDFIDGATPPMTFLPNLFNLPKTKKYPKPPFPPSVPQASIPYIAPRLTTGVGSTLGFHEYYKVEMNIARALLNLGLVGNEHWGDTINTYASPGFTDVVNDEISFTEGISLLEAWSSASAIFPSQLDSAIVEYEPYIPRDEDNVFGDVIYRAEISLSSIGLREFSSYSLNKSPLLGFAAKKPTVDDVHQSFIGRPMLNRETTNFPTDGSIVGIVHGNDIRKLWGLHSIGDNINLDDGGNNTFDGKDIRIPIRELRKRNEDPVFRNIDDAPFDDTLSTANIVGSTGSGPTRDITSFFRFWDRPPGVPFYHLLNAENNIRNELPITLTLFRFEGDSFKELFSKDYVIDGTNNTLCTGIFPDLRNIYTLSNFSTFWTGASVQARRVRIEPSRQFCTWIVGIVQEIIKHFQLEVQSPPYYKSFAYSTDSDIKYDVDGVKIPFKSINQNAEVGLKEDRSDLKLLRERDVVNNEIISRNLIQSDVVIPNLEIPNPSLPQTIKSLQGGISLPDGSATHEDNVGFSDNLLPIEGKIDMLPLPLLLLKRLSRLFSRQRTITKGKLIPGGEKFTITESIYSNDSIKAPHINLGELLSRCVSFNTAVKEIGYVKSFTATISTSKVDNISLEISNFFGEDEQNYVPTKSFSDGFSNGFL